MRTLTERFALAQPMAAEFVKTLTRLDELKNEQSTLRHPTANFGTPEDIDAYKESYRYYADRMQETTKEIDVLNKRIEAFSNWDISVSLINLMVEIDDEASGFEDTEFTLKVDGYVVYFDDEDGGLRAMPIEGEPASSQSQYKPEAAGHALLAQASDLYRSFFSFRGDDVLDAEVISVAQMLATLRLADAYANHQLDF